MPYFKTEKLRASNQAGEELLIVKINISSFGEFYTYIDKKFKTTVEGVFEFSQYDGDTKPDKIKVKKDTYEDLRSSLIKVLNIFAKPIITEEHVIRYNIESHVSFAEDQDGNIYPNAGFKGTEWGTNQESYGDHYAAQPSRGGYSLKIGAQAMIKKTYTYGESKKIEYSLYYKDGFHLNHNNPAELLNSWCSFTLGDKPKEIPYSDKAALFFHNLMLGMAQLSKRIQENTFTQDKLLELISKNESFLLPETT